jgi:hypothetical protein
MFISFTYNYIGSIIKRFAINRLKSLSTHYDCFI